MLTNEQEIPVHLATEDVKASVDVLQGGWGVNLPQQWLAGLVQHPPSTGQTFYDLVGQAQQGGIFTPGTGLASEFRWDSGQIMAVVREIEVLHTGGAAPETGQIDLVSPGGSRVTLVDFTLGVGLGANSRGHVDSTVANVISIGVMGHGANPIIVPPFPWELEILFPNTGVGESWTVVYFVQVVPAGLKPV